jgi:hypothetical protein
VYTECLNLLSFLENMLRVMMLSLVSRARIPIQLSWSTVVSLMCPRRWQGYR